MKKKLQFLFSMVALLLVATVAKAQIYIETDLTSQFADLTEPTNWTNINGGKAAAAPDWAFPAVEVNALGKKAPCEFYYWSCSTVDGGKPYTGDVFYQTVTGLAAGTYKIELYGAAAFTFDRGFGSTAFTGDLNKAVSDTYTAGAKIEPSETVSTGVTLYAQSEGVTYDKEIPIYYATSFPDGATIVTLNGVVVGESGSIKIGMNKTTTSTNWHVVQLKSVIATVNAEELLTSYIQKAQNDLDNAAYAAVTGSERTDLINAISENSTPEATEEAYKAAIKAVSDATTAFINAATGSYKTFAEAKAAVDFKAWPYASAAKKTAVEEAMAAVATSADDAAAKATALIKAYRQFVESNAIAEGVEGAVVMTDKIDNPAAESAIATPWTVVKGEGSGGGLDVKDNEPWTDGNESTNHKYFDGGDWGKEAWDVSLEQEITLDPGKYMLTAIARASGDVAFSLYAGETKVTIPAIGASGGIFNRGWNDQFVEFEVEQAGAVKIGVQGVTDKQYNWMSFSNFRLVQLEAYAAPAPTTYAITVAEGLENGSVVADPAEAAEGAKVTLTITPADGYELDVLSVKNGEEDVEVAEDYTFTMPAAAVAISATFKEKAVEPAPTLAAVKMTYVSNDSEEGDADKAFGEVTEAKAGFNKIIDDNEVGFGNTTWGRNYITYIQVDASSVPGGVVKKATLKADLSGTIDNNKRVAIWGVGYNSSAWSADMTYNTADKSIKLIEGATYTTASKNADTFESTEFDITEAFAEGSKTATIVVYETAAAGAIIKNVTVEVEMGDKEIEVDGIIYAIKSDNLIPNGSFDEGLTGWTQAKDFATTITSAGFEIRNEEGHETFLVGTQSEGGGGANSLGTAWGIEAGKTYLYSFDVKSLNQETGAGYLKSSLTNTKGDETESLGEPSVTPGEWTSFHKVFTNDKEYQYLQVKFRWLASNFGIDNFALYEVEQLSTALDAAKAKALLAIDALTPVGDGIFYYNADEIAAAKAAVAAATTIEEVEAVVMPTVKAPEATQAYAVTNVTAPGKLNIANEAITIADDASVYITAVEGGFVLSNADGEYAAMTSGSTWSMTTTTEIASAYVVSILPVEGGYAFKGANGIMGLDYGVKATDNTDKTVYADKSLAYNGVWTIAEYVVPEIALNAPTFNAEPGTQAEPNMLPEGSTLKITFTADNLAENNVDAKDVKVKATVMVSGDLPGETSMASTTAHRVLGETFYIDLGETDFPVALKEGYVYQNIAVMAATLVKPATEDAAEEELAVYAGAPVMLPWVGLTAPEPVDNGILIEIAQDQNIALDPTFAHATLVEGEEYNTYTANADLTIAYKMPNVDVKDCDYVIVKFAEPVAAGWHLAFWSGQDLVAVPAGSTEYKYVFAEDVNCGVKDGVLPQICMMTFFGGFTAPLEAKVTGVYKHFIGTELAQEINVERYTGMKYGVTEAEVDFSLAKEFLGVEEIAYNMLRIVNPDGTEISNYAPYDGWFNGEGTAEEWGDNTKICVKFYQAIEGNGAFAICDMNGADVLDATYAVKWALVANGKKVVYTINTKFVEKPVIALTFDDLSQIGDGIVVPFESECGSDYEGFVASVDIASILNTLGVESLKDVTIYAVQSDGTLDDDYKVGGGIDGWRNADGDWQTWGDNARFCVKVDFSAEENQIYYVGGMPGQNAEPAEYAATFAFVKNGSATNDAVVLKVTLAYDYPVGINGIEVAKAKANGKYIQKGKLYIVRDGKVFSANGVEMK